MSKPDRDAVYDPAEDYVEHEHEGGVSFRQAYDPNVARINAAYDKAMQEATERIRERIIAEHPEAAGLHFHRSRTYVSKPRPPGFSEVPLAILRKMLLPGWVGKTQKAILEAVQKDMPEYSIETASN